MMESRMPGQVQHYRVGNRSLRVVRLLETEVGDSTLTACPEGFPCLSSHRDLPTVTMSRLSTRHHARLPTDVVAVRLS